jgi:hypothetical protein
VAGPLTIPTKDILMTTTEKTVAEQTTYRILDLDGNICKVTRDDLIGLISTVEISIIAHQAQMGVYDLAFARVLGRDANGEKVKPLNDLSDYQLMRLWAKEMRNEAIHLREDNALEFDLEFEEDPDATELPAWDVATSFLIEGKEDGQMIEIERWELIKRLIAYQIEIDHHPAFAHDEGAGYYEALENGLKGFADYGIDELKEEWRETREGFYRRNEGNALTGKLDVDDPEYGDLVEEYADQPAARR